jgi:hypothetical protein
MIRITCDTCGKVKHGGQPQWIMGYDLQFSNTRAVGRSLSFFDRWEDSRLFERGAVHLCSLECKYSYTASSTLGTKTSGRKIAARRRHRKIA